jgi:hypothetical protein
MGLLRDPRVLLAAWEAAAARPEVARGAVLVAFDTGTTLAVILDLPVSACAAMAVSAFRETFGPRPDCRFACPSCRTPIHVPLDLDHLEAAVAADQEVGGLAVVVSGGRRELAVHCFSTQDLLDAAATADPAAELRGRIVRTADGKALPQGEIDGLTGAELAAVDTAADGLAGAAATVLRMDCPACGEQQRAAVDPGDLLWERVAITALRLMNQVATLARAFGWSEDETLALSAIRRGAYLELAETILAAPTWQAVGA